MYLSCCIDVSEVDHSPFYIVIWFVFVFYANLNKKYILLNVLVIVLCVELTHVYGMSYLKHGRDINHVSKTF